MLLFISFCSKERFRFSSAKLRCFQHYRTGFSLSSYVKCAFDPLSYRKHVLACWQWDRMFWAFCYKKPAISEYPFLSLIVAKIRFLHVGNKIALLWVLYHKKKGFCFFVAKTRWTRLYRTKNMFWFVCCNIGLFSVLLHQKGVFFQYAGSHPDFHSILLKQRFCFLLAKLRCLSIVFLRTTLFSVSVTKLHFGRSILLKNMLWFVCRKIVSSDIAPEKCFLPVCIESL